MTIETCFVREAFQIGFAVDFVKNFFVQTIYFGQILLHWICEGENNPLNVFLIFRELRWKLGSNPTQWESWNPHFKEMRFPDKSLNHFSNKSDLIKHRLSLIKWPHKNAEKTITYQPFFLGEYHTHLNVTASVGWVTYHVSRVAHKSSPYQNQIKTLLFFSQRFVVLFKQIDSPMTLP